MDYPARSLLVDTFIIFNSMENDHQQPTLTTASVGKTAIRRELLLRRRALGRDEWLQMSVAIQAHLMDMTEVLSASKVHCYVSMEDEREVSTAGLLAWLHSERKMVCMPYIERGCMVAATYQQDQCFSIPGIGPPVPDPLITTDKVAFDLVIVPLVGADPKGGRLGYGKGWYDRFFAQLDSLGVHPLRIGLAFGFQLLDALPSDPWDQLLDMVVTETGLINCMDGRA
jgi:5-formyltetrahydrofolate cyclo-ligase